MNRGVFAIATAVAVVFITVSVAADPGVAAEALDRGRVQLREGHYARALESFEAAFAAGYMPHEAAFGAAAAASRLGDREQTEEWLKKAARSGFRDYGRVRQLDAFSSLLDDAQFLALVDGLDLRAHPCQAPEYRALDFWLGTWTVTDSSSGNPAGRSRIELDMDNCVVMENWTGRTGWIGRSFNVFRKDTGRWQQTWADSSGQIYDFEGVPSRNRMVYSRTTKTPEVGERLIRMTLQKDDDGNVRQLSERSDDGGKTWAVNYDFTYSPAD